MKPVLTPAELNRLDAESATPVHVLMDRAGMAVALEAVRMGAKYGTTVAVLTGPGNNGGDGYVAAGYLARRGVNVQLLALAQPRTEAAIQAAATARACGVPVRRLASPRGPVDLIIDAVFGGGLRDGVPDELYAWMETDIPVLAVDVPSGLNPTTGVVGDRSFSARTTTTFHSFKTGHILGEGPDRCGRLKVVDIGLEGGAPELLLVEASDAPRPGRDRRVHKWSAGSVLVVGGSEGMVGAAVFAAKAALAFGAGAVGVASGSLPVVQTLAPEILAYPQGEIPERFDVLVVGPGLGGSAPDMRQAMASDKPMVVDADALALLPTDTSFDRPVVLTPHAGEFSKMTGSAPGPDAARKLAADLGAVVVLKGNPTFVTDGGIPRVVTTGGPALATIGTGDVLAGMIGALLARGLSALDAATSAAYWHGVAGTELSRTRTLTADVLASGVGFYAWEAV